MLPSFGRGFAGRGHACSQGAVWGGSGADASGLGFRHCRNSPQQVAVGVGEVARVAAEEGFVAEVVVGAEGGVSQHGVAEAVYAEFFRHVFGRYLVELGFGHFFAADEQPAVHMELRQVFYACGHEHRRPVDAVEADDVFA